MTIRHAVVVAAATAALVAWAPPAALGALGCNQISRAEVLKIYGAKTKAPSSSSGVFINGQKTLGCDFGTVSVTFTQGETAARFKSLLTSERHATRTFRTIPSLGPNAFWVVAPTNSYVNGKYVAGHAPFVDVLLRNNTLASITGPGKFGQDELFAKLLEALKTT